MTFEELVSGELNRLYGGALFLAAGNEAAASDLVVETVTDARAGRFSAPVESSAATRWLEAALARTYARSTAEPHSRREPPASAGQRPGARWGANDPEAFRALGAADLNAAAARVRPAARAALWLVTLRRWNHADAADVLSIEVDALRELLAGREDLLSGLVGRVGPRARKAGHTPE
ncbi:MAG: hypothetical protein ABFS34_04270 [Gemmatimonadota bacterium]